jgi:hypothetical protein
MYFNRFDIVEAYYLALCHCHAGQYSRDYARLCHIGQYFKPGALFSYESLTDNGRAIYDALIPKLLEA